MPIRHLTFDAGESVTAPLTWGQYAIWKPLQWFGDATASFNLSRSFALARPVTGERFLDGVRTLVERHSSLRTHFVDGEQRIAGTGEMAVAFHPLPAGADAAAHAADIAGTLTADSFDLTTAWPVRFAAVLSPAEQVVAVVLVASHVAVDNWAVESLAEDLRVLLGAEPAPATEPDSAWSPLEQLGFERSEAGRQLAAGALRHWGDRLQAAPATMFDFAPVPADGPPIHRYRMVSPAVAVATPILAARSHTSISTVLLTVTALWLAAYSGHDAAVLQLITGNRFDARLRALRAPTAQDGLFVLPRQDVALSAAFRQAFPAAVRGYRNGQYHLDDLVARQAEVGLARGLHFDLSAYFNDARRDRDWAPPATVPDPAELAGLRAASTFSRFESLPRHDMKFMLSFNRPEPDRCGLVLLADGRYLPPPVGERFLRGLELVVCAAVHEELSVADVARLCGVAPVVRGPDWVRTRAGWTRPEAVRRLVAGLLPGAAVTAAWRPAAGPEQVVDLAVYVAVDGAASPEPLPDLHRRVVAALPGEPGVVAPDRYILCRGPVDPDADLARWEALPVIDHGTGRPVPVSR
ncbi:condensation domain-containing protein [Polymorphospora rubra]|nr:condensation domain-containing protein [Polymorphospora rubra]